MSTGIVEEERLELSWNPSGEEIQELSEESRAFQVRIGYNKTFNPVSKTVPGT